MVTSTAPRPVGGALALDFANTAAGRGSAAPVERLPDPAALLAWGRAAGLLTPSDAAALARESAAARALHRRALGLREAIWRVGFAVAAGEAAPGDDLELLRRRAARALDGAALARAADGRYAIDFAEAPDGDALLGPVAWSALELLTRGGPGRLKCCPGEGCGWLFLDASRNGSRRWCDMATCGNRAKARRFRAGRA